MQDAAATGGGGGTTVIQNNYVQVTTNGDAIPHEVARKINDALIGLRGVGFGMA